MNDLMDLGKACAILGVGEKAFRDEIRKKWRILAHQWHPDKHDSPTAPGVLEKSQLVNAARDALFADPNKIPGYDVDQCMTKCLISRAFFTIKVLIYLLLFNLGTMWCRYFQVSYCLMKMIWGPQLPHLWSFVSCWIFNNLFLNT